VVNKKLTTRNNLLQPFDGESIDAASQRHARVFSSVGAYRMMKKILLSAVASFALATAAQAAINVSIWTGQPAAGANATVATAAGLGAPTATTTVGAINFNSAVGGYTIGGFLNNPVLPAAVASASLNDTYMLFTGQITLAAGANLFSITHDDGLQLIIDGGVGTVVNQPGPTAPVATPFTATAPSAGTYNFQLAYGECCGPPADLIWFFNGAPVGTVPEPASWAMMLLGFAGIGMAIRRSRKPGLELLA
jgi:hypothetical protein